MFGPYADNFDTFESLCLAPGSHTLAYFDSYGDGWNGGWWELCNGQCSDDTRIAGGSTGVVEGAGGETTFTLAGGAGGVAPAPRKRVGSVNVQITTFDWADEIS